MFVRFPENKSYNEFIFEKGKVYVLDFDFAQRWIKRGCEMVENYNGEVFPDPRFPNDVPLQPVVESVIVEPEIEIVEAEIDNTEVEVDTRPRKKSTMKK